MEATASVKCPHCGADLQEKGVLEIKASIVDVDAEGRLAYEARRTPLDEVEGYACSVCNGQLDFEDDPVAEFTQLRVPEAEFPAKDGKGRELNVGDDVVAGVDMERCAKGDRLRVVESWGSAFAVVVQKGCEDPFVMDAEDVSLVDDSVAEVRDDIVYSLRMNGEADAETLRNWIGRLNALAVGTGGEACGIDLDGIEED